MVQHVVTHENMQQLIETGTVDEYKPPESKSDKPVDQTVAVDAKTISESDKKVEDGADADEKDLPEKITKIINKKHRAMMEAKEAASDAETFAETQYRERKAAEKRADELEARLKALESKAAPKVEEAVEPQPQDFKDGVEFARALAKFEADKAVKAYQQLQAETRQKADAAALDAARIARNKAFAQTVDDYEETVASLTDHDLVVPPVMGQYLMESEASAALMYYFAKHPSEFEAIAQLSPIKAIAAMGKLEIKLEPKVESKDEPKVDVKSERSRAPTPITPVTGNQGTVDKPLAEMNTRETIEYWEARNKATVSRRQRH